MNVLEAMQQAYLLATGKSTLPDSSSSKYNRLYNLVLKFYKDWQTEPGVDWNSLYQTLDAGAITATDTFDIDEDIIKLSQRKGDYVRIVTTSNTYYYKTINASRLNSNRYDHAVARVGNSLVFSKAFISTDPHIGGTLLVPCYVRLDDLTSTSDDILIDNPAWLPVVVAAQYVLSDAQLQYQYPDLLSQAQDLMNGMKLANDPQDETYDDDYSHFDNGSDEC
jgi:hypothetical protein